MFKTSFVKPPYLLKPLSRDILVLEFNMLNSFFYSSAIKINHTLTFRRKQHPSPFQNCTKHTITSSIVFDMKTRTSDEKTLESITETGCCNSVVFSREVCWARSRPEGRDLVVRFLLTPALLIISHTEDPLLSLSLTVTPHSYHSLCTTFAAV